MAWRDGSKDLRKRSEKQQNGYFQSAYWDVPVFKYACSHLYFYSTVKWTKTVAETSQCTALSFYKLYSSDYICCFFIFDLFSASLRASKRSIKIQYFIIIKHPAACNAAHREKITSSHCQLYTVIIYLIQTLYMLLPVFLGSTSLLFCLSFSFSSFGFVSKIRCHSSTWVHRKLKPRSQEII